jgi:aspartate/methionine/tyrosine aminotransferase
MSAFCRVRVIFIERALFFRRAKPDRPAMTTPAQRLSPVYTGMPVTIFEHMSGLAREQGAINLGQGFPDDAPPPELVEAVVRATRERSHQYPPMAGLAELRDAVAGSMPAPKGCPLRETT